MKKHTLVALLVLVALSLWRCSSDDAAIQSVTRVDDLEITGTTDATGVVTARAGVRLTTPTTGPIFTSGSGIPAGTATIGSLYLRTDTAQLYQNTDGATAWSQLGASSGGGGYAGTWSSSSTPYAAGSIVRRGWGTWGTTTSTSQDPAVTYELCNGSVVNTSDWTVVTNTTPLTCFGETSVGFVNGLAAQQRAIYSKATFTDSLHGRRTVIDVVTGPNGGADGLYVGYLDATSAVTSTLPRDLPGMYGVFIDIWATGSGSRICLIAAGVQSCGANNNFVAIESYQQNRWLIDTTISGATMTWMIYTAPQQFGDSTSTPATRPYLVYTSTTAAPSFASGYRLVAGALSGGVAGQFYMSGFWLSYQPGFGDWSLLDTGAQAARMHNLFD